MRLSLSLSGIRTGIAARYGRRRPTPATVVDADLQRQVEIARAEWRAAQQYFQTVSDPELVDHAIYTLEAARRKYHYLFRRLRQSVQQRTIREE